MAGHAHSFTSAVRRSKVATPERPSFSVASWDAGFAKYSDGSLEDLRLHAAGLWFGDVFRCMREEFERLRAPGEPVELYQRRAIGLVNRECQRATTSAEAQDVAGTDEFAMHELVQQEVEFGGAMVKPAEILEGVVDALRLELSSERPMNEEKRQIAKGVPDARLEYTMERFWRMRAYDGMRHLWDQCRWHCWPSVSARGEPRRGSHSV